MPEKWEMAGFRAEVASVSVRFRPEADIEKQPRRDGGLLFPKLSRATPSAG